MVVSTAWINANGKQWVSYSGGCFRFDCYLVERVSDTAAFSLHWPFQPGAYVAMPKDEYEKMRERDRLFEKIREERDKVLNDLDTLRWKIEQLHNAVMVK